jgi:hypothetical protein
MHQGLARDAPRADLESVFGSCAADSITNTEDVRHERPFLAAGIPVFTLWVKEGDYDPHAVSDTYGTRVPAGASADS